MIERAKSPEALMIETFNLVSPHRGRIILHQQDSSVIRTPLIRPSDILGLEGHVPDGSADSS
jgi:hypothetical protein